MTAGQPAAGPVDSSAAATTPSDVVIGYDGTIAADAALDWAAHEADRRGVHLRVVCANPFASAEWAGFANRPAPPPSSAVYSSAVVAQGRDRARQVLADGDLSVMPVPTAPIEALVDASRTAALLVLGHRARSRFGEVVAGSVINAVAAHAHCDVAVVPRGDLVLPGPDRPVVVGVDGSAHADSAAERAAEHAERWGAALVLVQAWEVPRFIDWPEGLVSGSAGIVGKTAYFQQAAEDSVEQAAAMVRAAHPGLSVRTAVAEGHPVDALRDAAAGAGLLVVGTRGLGGFERLLLGSTSRAVVHHATGPVLVVRPPTP